MSADHRHPDELQNFDHKAAEHRLSRLWPGIAVASLVVAAAYLLRFAPVAPFRILDETGDVRYPIGASIIAILIGIVVANFPGSDMRFRPAIHPGCGLVLKIALPLSIVLIGAGLNLADFVRVGPAILAIVLICMTAVMLGTLGIGRLLGLRPEASLLLAGGTAVCGSNAIVALAPVVRAREDDLALSIGAINLYGLLIMLLLPLIGATGGLHAMSATDFGTWAGSSVHAVPQAIATGWAHSPEAGETASAVKLVRVALLAPLVVLVAAVLSRSRRNSTGKDAGEHPSTLRLVPWFVWVFALMAVINTAANIQAADAVTVAEWFRKTSGPVKIAAEIMLTAAMAAIGLQVHVRSLVKVGATAMLAGLLATVALAAISFILISVILP